MRHSSEKTATPAYTALLNLPGQATVRAAMAVRQGGCGAGLFKELP